jgi:glycosyltransferase involved in cell wall biosynthesis
LKICHVNLSRTFRGGERQTLLLAIECVKRYGSSSTLLVCRRGGTLAASAGEIEGLEVFEVDSQISGHYRVKRWSPNLVHAHEGRAVYWAFIHYILFRSPYILTRRIQNQRRPRLLNQIVYNRARHIVAISRAIEAELRERFTLITVIPSAVAPEPVHSRRVSEKKPRSILMAGALDPAKGHSIMLKALVSMSPDWTLYIIGDGPKLESITNFIDVHGLGPRTQLFAWDSKKIRELLESCEYFVMPSLHEGLGSVLLDAMGAGCLVVASNVGGIPDLVIDNVSGRLCPPGDPESIVATLVDLDSNQDVKEALRKGGKKMAGQHMPSKMMSQYEVVYKKVLSE